MARTRRRAAPVVTWTDQELANVAYMAEHAISVQARAWWAKRLAVMRAR